MVEDITQPQPSNIPTPPPITNPPVFPISTILALVIVAIVSGASVYLWQQSEIKKLQTLSQQSIVEPTPTSSLLTPSLSPTSTDPRIEFSAQQWNEKFFIELKKGVTCSNFYESRFSADSNTTVTYISDKYGYSIDFPFNPIWGDNENRVKPYENRSDGSHSYIWFGRPYANEGCSFYRISMAELAPSTIDQAISQINVENEKIKKAPDLPPGDDTATYQKLSGFKFPVLRVDTGNAMFGSVPSYQVFLPRVTLEFSSPFTLDQKIFTQLMASLKIL